MHYNVVKSRGIFLHKLYIVCARRGCTIGDQVSQHKILTDRKAALEISILQFITQLLKQREIDHATCDVLKMCLAS